MLMAKARMGDITEDERIELQDALYGLAPSSPEYKTISNVLGVSNGPTSVEDLPIIQGPESFGYLVGADATPVAEPEKYNDAQSGGFGGPTLDFLSPFGQAQDNIQQGFDDVATGLRAAEKSDDSNTYIHPEISGGLPIFKGGERLTPAEASYTQGSAPIGSGTHVDEFGNYYDFPQGGGTVANSLYRPNPIEDDLPDIGVNQFPGGYSFSGGNESSVDILSGHPELWARQQAERAGTPNMAAFLEPRSNASLNMATMGLIGEDINDTLGGGSTTPTGRLAASEDFMKQFDAPGVQFVDPADIWNQAFERANNTDFSSMTSPQTGQVMTPEEIISTTNDALMTSMGFSTPETEAWATSLLNNAAQEYMLALANGETDLSYPAFLESMGLSNLLG